MRKDVLTVFNQTDIIQAKFIYIYICHIIHSELNECEVVIIAEILFIRKCTVGNIVSINNDSRGGIMTFSLW